MSLKEAAKQALDALEDPWSAGPDGVAAAITALRAALNQERYVVTGNEFHGAPPEPYANWGDAIAAMIDRGVIQGLRISALTEDAMQRLTNIQQEIQNQNVTPDMQSANSVHPRVSDGSNRGVEPVTDCHEKWGNFPFPFDRSADTGKTSDHFPDATKIIEPVAYVNDEGWFRHAADADAAFRATARPLYAAPPKRKPLTVAEIQDVLRNTFVDATVQTDDMALIRAIERAHDIGGEE